MPSDSHVKSNQVIIFACFRLAQSCPLIRAMRLISRDFPLSKSLDSVYYLLSFMSYEEEEEDRFEWEVEPEEEKGPANHLEGISNISKVVICAILGMIFFAVVARLSQGLGNFFGD